MTIPGTTSGFSAKKKVWFTGGGGKLITADVCNNKTKKGLNKEPGPDLV